MANNSFIIHGHFYQPPREDPMTGEIPVEPGAAPYRNWNEKIHAECYQPNAALGNFGKISFNIGPTLLTWMSEFDPLTYHRILEQDRENVTRHGVGNAMAQAYNHTILPLASREDKVTQVKWGIADFQHRFQRAPKGMWLPETAVDLECLEVLAENGIEFTILAPWQATTERVDPTQPYRVDLPSGRSIVVFFYDQEISTRVSFDPGSTTNADSFLVNYLTPKYTLDSLVGKQAQLIVVASDGELYGHHQPFRDKFLAHLMDGALDGKDLTPTFPEQWLKEHPVRNTIQIREDTSWSCHHGVMRWCGECACTPGGGWKAPFRHALNRIAALVDDAFDQAVRPYVSEPMELRNAYIRVILGYSSPRDLILSMARQPPDNLELERIELLLAAQYQRQRMFTSCGWFFDDFDRIEPRNNVAYTAEAVWLTEMATGVDLASQALTLLGKVKSGRSWLKADQVFLKYLNRSRMYSEGV